MPSLFHKKSKSSLRSKVISEPFDFVHHNRTMSTSSTHSTSSTISQTKIQSYDPLCSHPPLALNTSPVVPEEAEESSYTEEEHHYQLESQSKQQHSSDSHDDDHYSQESRDYEYEQSAQWPLKDWQAIPPSLANSHRKQDHSRDSSASPSQNRPARQENPADSFVRRGDWKRRGIIFGLDSVNQMEQVRQFENPFEWSNSV